jgi:hypothetical protein
MLQNPCTREKVQRVVNAIGGMQDEVDKALNNTKD